MNIQDQEPYKSMLVTKAIETQRTYAAHYSVLRDFLKKEVYEATQEELKSYFLHCQTMGLKKSTIGTKKAALQVFFKYLRIHKDSPFHRSDDPMLIVSEDIKQIVKNKDKTKRRALTVAQRKQVYDSLIWEGPDCTLKEYQISLCMFISFNVGLRRFEIAKLQWNDFDFELKELTVLGKGAKKVTIPIANAVLERLKAFKPLMDASHIDTRWVFFNPQDPSKHWGKFTIGHWFKIIKKRVGFGPEILFASHDGRRIFCTSLYENGIEDLDAIVLTRHEDVGMYNRYLRKNENKLRDAVNKNR